MAAALELEAIRWGTAKLQGAGKRHPPLPLARPSSAEAASCRGTGVTAGQVAPRRTSSQPSSDLKKCSMVQIAAFIAEPVMGAGGVIAPPKTYFEKVSPYTILGIGKCEEAEEETTSKTLAPLNEDVKKTLEDISHRLESSLDNLVADCGSIQARFAEIQALISDDSANTISPASNIDRLEARKIDLIAQLQECNAELDLEKQKLANLPNAVEEQKSRLKSAIKNVADMTKSIKVIPGTDAQDIQAIEEVDQIREQAVSAI
uniref:Aminotransferase n=1 Tax=Oryza sativa subsp. japonica TaxID=39947 RepID=Q8S5F4_ORYSJ|nr:Putative aminotransferase [Oryza sativa Japonica Group]